MSAIFAGISEQDKKFNQEVIEEVIRKVFEPYQEEIDLRREKYQTEISVHKRSFYEVAHGNRILKKLLRSKYNEKIVLLKIPDHIDIDLRNDIALQIIAKKRLVEDKLHEDRLHINLQVAKV
jgi:hypothetical protein